MSISFICMFLIYPYSYNKIPQIRGLKQKKFIFHSSGNEKSKIKVPVKLVSGERLIPDS